MAMGTAIYEDPGDCGPPPSYEDLFGPDHAETVTVVAAAVAATDSFVNDIQVEDHDPTNSCEETLNSSETGTLISITTQQLSFFKLRNEPVTQSQIELAFGKYVNELQRKRFPLHIVNIQTEYGYRYDLGSLIERRRSIEVLDPYRGEVIDGLENGPQPNIMDMKIPLPKKFENGQLKFKIPHSDVISECSVCVGSGIEVCTRCDGTQFVTCSDCSGARRNNTTCNNCFGYGKRVCSRCDGQEIIKCHGCQGHCWQKKYRVLVVKWTTKKIEEVCLENVKTGIHYPEILEHLKHNQKVTGNVIVSGITEGCEGCFQTSSMVVDCLNREIVTRSQLPMSSENKSIVRQIHQVTQIPVVRVNFKLNGKIDHFFLYGNNHIIHLPNEYPIVSAGPKIMKAFLNLL